MLTTSRSVGGAGDRGCFVISAFGACIGSAAIGRGASSEARNCRPPSVICQPLSSRSTNESAKMSSLGARAAKRFVRLVHSVPLEIRMLTQRVRSAIEARPARCSVPASSGQSIRNRHQVALGAVRNRKPFRELRVRGEAFPRTAGAREP